MCLLRALNWEEDTLKFDHTHTTVIVQDVTTQSNNIYTRC